MKMNPECFQCMLDKRLNAFPEGATPEQAEAYREAVRRILAEYAEASGPEVSLRIDEAYEALFGPRRDFTEEKERFNALMLSVEPAMQRRVDAAGDPLSMAVRFSMLGNFIDYQAMPDVDEDKLLALLDGAEAIPLDAKAIEELRAALGAARRLVLLTDNCGEIVADKVLLRTILKLWPSLEAVSMVRGQPAANDATLEDAVQVGLDAVAPVMGNGSAVAGTVLEDLSGEARAALDAADVILAKGQGNYETLCGCGLNVYYLFLCKCALFTRRFGVDLYSGVLTREGDAPGD